VRAHLLPLLSPQLWASILAWWFDRKEETREQDAEKVRLPVLFIWSVSSVWSIRSVSCVWLNETNQIDQTNQRDQINQMDQTDRARIGSRDTWVRSVVGGRLRAPG
jgi:hypothetical protein